MFPDSQTLSIGALPARVPSHSPGVHFISAYISKETFPQGVELTFEGFNLLQRFSLPEGTGAGVGGGCEPFLESVENTEPSPQTNKLPFKTLSVNLDGLEPIWSPMWETHRAHMRDSGFLECLYSCAFKFRHNLILCKTVRSMTLFNLWHFFTS